MRHGRARLWVAAALVPFLAGCSGLLGSVDGTGLGGPVPGGGGGGPTPISDREPPTIQNPTVTPTTLRFTGGRVALSVQVTDPGGVAAVWVEIVSPEGAATTQALAESTPSLYTGEWTAPPNAGDSGAPRVFTVTLHARDVAGNEASTEGITVTVQAPSQPPAGLPAL